MNLKNCLRQIEPDSGNLRHDRPPLWILADPPWHIDAVGGRSHHQRLAVFIVDDMIGTGGTMRRTAAACRARGAQRVFAAATHGLFGAGSDKLLADPAIDRIIVTDSVSTAKATAGRAEGRVDIVPAAPLIAEAIHRLHVGEPLGDATSLED